MTITDFPDSQVLASFCSTYWLFQVLRGDADPRVYRLPEFPSDWPTEARWTNPEESKTDNQYVLNEWTFIPFTLTSWKALQQMTMTLSGS